MSNKSGRIRFQNSRSSIYFLIFVPGLEILSCHKMAFVFTCYMLNNGEEKSSYAFSKSYCSNLNAVYLNYPYLKCIYITIMHLLYSCEPAQFGLVYKCFCNITNDNVSYKSINNYDFV